MKILARGEKSLIIELKQKLSLADGDITEVYDTDLPAIDLQVFDVIFDLNFDSHMDNLRYYASLTGKPVFVSAAKAQLAK